jgi:uncharacterized protein YecE (DUF72 family)
MGDIYVGTSGYSYKSWEGEFYPSGMDKKEYLGYYIHHFSFVELNFSYYRQPNTAMLQKIVDKTPADFRFSIKGHRSFTHERSDEWRQQAQQFQQDLRPLVEADAIAVVLLQFPYSFHYTPENRLYLDELTQALSDLPLAVEFRNTEWLHDDVYEGMRKRGLSFVVTDTPDLPKLPGASGPASIPPTTSSIGYMRFHGRNRDNWWTGDNTTRYDYLYSEQELSSWIDRIEELMHNTRILFIAFNNHHKGQAVKNSLQLMGLLEERKLPVVKPGT